jgi:hypothetical protein
MTDRSPIAALLQNWRDREFAQHHNSTLAGLCDELEAAIAAQVETERWIPVVERLPPKEAGEDSSEFVLVVVPSGHRLVAFYNCKFHMWLNGVNGQQVPATHWTYLPEGPKP